MHVNVIMCTISLRQNCSLHTKVIQATINNILIKSASSYSNVNLILLDLYFNKFFTRNGIHFNMKGKSGDENDQYYKESVLKLCYEQKFFLDSHLHRQPGSKRQY